jgi:predicted metalloprotease with PDZ domain
MPGKRSDKTDGRNLGGMDLVQKDGKIVIDSVNIESPAEKAGLHVDDEIVSLGDLDASRSRTYELQYKMSQPGSVQVITRRGEKQFKTTIELK